MRIRQAEERELDKILKIYEQARVFMRENGNATQWQDGYPSAELVLREIVQGNQYVCEEDGEIVATFSLCEGPDPTYQEIWEGQWFNDAPYKVLHRLASTGGKGAGKFCLQWSIAQSSDLRVDTHEENLPMQRLLQKNGFVKCGKIRVADGTERIAFQKL